MLLGSSSEILLRRQPRAALGCRLRVDSLWHLQCNGQYSYADSLLLHGWVAWFDHANTTAQQTQQLLCQLQVFIIYQGQSCAYNCRRKLVSATSFGHWLDTIRHQPERNVHVFPSLVGECVLSSGRETLLCSDKPYQSGHVPGFIYM